MCFVIASVALAACVSPGAAKPVRIVRPLPAVESNNYDRLDDQNHSAGSAVISIRQDSDALVLGQSYTDPQQHTDDGSVTVDAASMQPRSAYRQIDTGSVRAMLDVKYANGTVSAVANDGQEHRHQAKVTTATYDDQESFFLLRTLDFSPGTTEQFAVSVVDAAKGTISRVLATARVVGTTKINLKGQQYSAWEVQLTGAGATSTAWYDASDPGRRLLRYTSARRTTLELRQ
jgi:hypothetical protein